MCDAGARSRQIARTVAEMQAFVRRAAHSFVHAPNKNSCILHMPSRYLVSDSRGNYGGDSAASENTAYSTPICLRFCKTGSCCGRFPLEQSRRSARMIF